jgi:flavin reductase (DIM6/NTAB) family NADH-FMN oxidoreductase RutF
MRVLSVQRCSIEPRLVAVAARKGHPIEPVIRDSHAFAICTIEQSQKLVLRKFSTEPGPDAEDPFDSFTIGRLVTGSPVLARCAAVLDCEVVRHFDLEADHENFVGLVVAARIGPKT